MKKEKELCPKCGKPFLKQGYLGIDDKFKGLVVHTMKETQGLFGGVIISNGERCMLNAEQWDSLENHPELEPQKPIGVPYYEMRDCEDIRIKEE